MKVDREYRGPVLIVKVAGELDHHTADILREAMEGELRRDIARDVVLDLSQLSFMDSSGLGVLLGRYKALSRWQGRMLACGLQPPVEKIFNLTGLRKLIGVHRDVEACLQALGGRQ